MRRRLEERADLFTEVFGREVELITTLGAADPGEVFPSVFGLMERG